MRKRIPLACVFFVWAAIFPGFSAEAGPGGDAGRTPDRKGSMSKTVTLGSLADRYEPVTFDHSGHVDMASGCGDCHHQHGPDRTLGCRECHSIDPSAFRKSVNAAMFRACRECHAGPAPHSDPARTGLAAAYHRACFRCHREVGNIGEDPKSCTETCHAKREDAKSARK